MKFLCLVDRPFLVVSCLKKNKRWDFTEQLWLKIAVQAQGAFFKLWPKSHQFLPNKSDSHCPRGGFRFKPIWNLSFYFSSEKKTKKTVVFAFKKYLYKTTTFANCVVFERYVNNCFIFLVEYVGWGYRQNWKKNFKQKVRFWTNFQFRRHLISFCLLC